MEGNKIIHKDPFLGEIELTKVGETSMDMVGESIVKTIYIDGFGGYYISSWTTTGGDPVPLQFLSEDLVDKLVEIHIKLK